ncbi:MAG: peptidylprolyl isomerase [Saprospiraceae bacterium]|nr:peptidylprolyl isomerase [Saprospiraceae bacterium]MBK6479023.1 peptidylprolyl isomerase [Saprospiraceae bacterium]MBK6817348.1 peptidylprolyl isomerase [Saprospiraceae bacterium]MBK7439434.1 peptidylprolyl isomerase [Saprospiraceae bacterium]MBK7605877.1 peptidylprolyl isomerase [Saprospiraceae bacterium]
MRIISIFLLGLFIINQSCIPVKKDQIAAEIDTQSVEIRLQDSTIRNVLQAQNDQDLQALISYFGATDPSVRYAATAALGSVRDSSIIDTLSYMLHDANVSVSAAAAYSLGLIGSPRSQSALIGAFRQYDTAGINSSINSAILEAIGRTGTADFLHAMATVETYEPTDTLLLLGQIRGIYRYMLRGIVDPAGTTIALKYATGEIYPQEVRLMAAHYLSRAKNLDLSGQADLLNESTAKENNPDVKLALILALGKTKSSTALTTLTNVISQDQDTRMVSNALRSLSNFDYQQVKTIILTAIRHSSISVATAALNYLNDFGREADANEYRNIARENIPWQVKVPLLAIANKNYSYAYAITKGNINGELKSIFGRSDNIQEKIACLKALGSDPKNINYLLEVGRQSDIPAIHAAVMESGIESLKSKYFNNAFGGSGESVKKNIIAYIMDKLATGDDAALEIIESSVKDQSLGLKSIVDPAAIEQIKTTLANNPTPTTPYAQYMLDKTLNALKGTSTPLSHMTNYKKLTAADFTLDGVTAVAEIVTDKGSIKIKLLKEIAPATVLNFVRLSKSEFYNGKYFHRVVPNFVIQGGCPRGDGYGSMDYSIRSETPQIYYNKAGMVGMASSGNHTESCQFFITHSPTPHLDGNYTIFAQVIEGIDVVNSIQIGDKILRINFTE